MASSSFTAFDYGAGTKNWTKTYIMGGFGLTRAEDWKALMATAYTLLTTNELLSTDFSDASAKETLKLIDDEFIKSHLEMFDSALSGWAQRAAQGIIEQCKANPPQYITASEIGESSKSIFSQCRSCL